jgi:hypothetical protein
MEEYRSISCNEWKRGIILLWIITRLVVVNLGKISITSPIEPVCSQRVQGFKGSRIQVKSKKIFK